MLGCLGSIKQSSTLHLIPLPMRCLLLLNVLFHKEPMCGCGWVGWGWVGGVGCDLNVEVSGTRFFPFRHCGSLESGQAPLPADPSCWSRKLKSFLPGYGPFSLIFKATPFSQEPILRSLAQCPSTPSQSMPTFHAHRSTFRLTEQGKVYLLQRAES